MPLNKDSVVDFFQEAMGRILIAIGVLFVGGGLLFASSRGSLPFALGLFLGVLFIVVGFGIQAEVFSVNFLSKDGIGTLLILISPLLIVSGFIFMFFSEPDWSQQMLIPKMVGLHLVPGRWVLIVPLARIYIWLTMPLLIAGALSFAAGLLLKVFDNYF